MITLNVNMNPGCWVENRLRIGKNWLKTLDVRLRR